MRSPTSPLPALAAAPQFHFDLLGEFNAFTAEVLGAGAAAGGGGAGATAGAAEGDGGGGGGGDAAPSGLDILPPLISPPTLLALPPWSFLGGWDLP